MQRRLALCTATAATAWYSKLDREGNSNTFKIFCHEAPKAPAKELKHKVDLYNGVNIAAEALSDNKEEFNSSMKESLVSWRGKGLRGVWLRLPIKKVHLVDDAVHTHGFSIHSAQTHEVLLNKFLPEGKSSLPHAPSWFCGVGIICISKSGKILAVQEKNGWLKGKGFWKMPTGLSDAGESIADAALRELYEETGIKGRFNRIIGMQQGAGTLGKGDIFMVCIVEPLNEDIVIQESEIETAAWLDVDEFFKQEWLYRDPGRTKLLKAVHKQLTKKEKKGVGFVHELFPKTNRSVYVVDETDN